jgi:acetyltransferase-like isoleucine patch superfamily enzyme
MIEDRLEINNAEYLSMKRYVNKFTHILQSAILTSWYKLFGPPRILRFNRKLNATILRAFGANISNNYVRIDSPITFHHAKNGYANLTVSDGCVIGGNNYLDLHSRITLEKGVSLGAGAIIMTHNGFNSNPVLEKKLDHLIGSEDVLIKAGASIKAGALIFKGVTIGENALVTAGSLVTSDVPPEHFAMGAPARNFPISLLEKS